MRTEDNHRTPYKTGDRFVMAQADFSPSLPGNTQMASYNVRIWHKSQEIFCRRCKSKNHHKTSDVDHCDQYRGNSDDVITFRDDCDILSNVFMSNVTVFGRVFRSAEHAYQWRKCIDCLRPDLASRIMRAYTPKKAKMIARALSSREIGKWRNVSGHVMVMREVLYAKAMSNIDFCHFVANSGDKIIAECTRDMLWGTGLSPYLTKTSRMFPGENLLGELLMQLRHMLRSGRKPSSPSIPESMLPLPVDTSMPPPRSGSAQITTKKVATPTHDPSKSQSVMNTSASHQQIDDTKQPDIEKKEMAQVPTGAAKVDTSSNAQVPNVPPHVSTSVSCVPKSVATTECSVDVNSSDDVITLESAVITTDSHDVITLESVVTSNESGDVSIGSTEVTPGISPDRTDVTSGTPPDRIVPDVCNTELTSDQCKHVTTPQQSPPELFSLSPGWMSKFPKKNNKKRPAQSPLIGKLLGARRRLNTPMTKFQARNLFPDIDSDSCLDSDDEPFYWGRASIANEILTCDDFDGMVANTSDI